MTSKIIYQGQLRTSATHLKSGEVIINDAPTDNEGKGEAFSPTDMVATALGTCMVTIMGIKARDNGWDIDGTVLEINKIMASHPRRIAEVKVRILMPNRPYDPKTKTILEKAAKTCPVALSLHPDLKQSIEFIWT